MFKNRKGITLIELLLVMALVAIVIPAIYLLYNFSDTSYRLSTNKGFSQQDVRVIGNFVESEIKYITNLALNEDLLNNEYQDYYSLRVENVNGKNFLVRTFHEYIVGSDESDPNPYVTSDTKRVSGNWDKIKISYSNVVDVADLINVFIVQTEGSGASEAKYELPLSIDMINNPKIEHDIETDLMINGNILYYQKAINTYADIGIDILPNEGDSGGEGGNGDSGETLNLGTIIVKGKNDIIVNPIDGVYHLGHNNNYSIEVAFTYTGDKINLNTTAVGVVNSINKPKIEGEKIVLDDRTNKQGNFSIDLKIFEISGHKEDSITINLSTND